MGYRTLEINLISAKGLKQVNLFTKMDMYAVVSISDGGTKVDKQKTPVDSEGDSNPTWNIPMKFSIDEAAAQQDRLTLIIMLRCERSLGDKDVGEVIVPIKDLLNGAQVGKTTQFVQYQVRKPSGRPKGELSFSYKFDEKVVRAEKTGELAAEKICEPAAEKVNAFTAYPAPAPTTGTSSMYPSLHEVMAAGAYQAPVGGYHPSAPTPAGYGYPPPQYGGYPPPQYGYQPQPGYGYPPVQQPQKNNKFGLGLGAGLLGGALGGLLIGDMVSDAGSYGGGFCDGGF
ncbi:hypothetical protein LguiA_031186 [Lonicera macranthoides]